MDDFKDFFKELRERVSSPFIMSFMISWIFSNWPITIALLFYKKVDLKDDGFNTFIDLIRHYSSWWGMFFLPLICAFTYSYYFPKVKSFFKLRHATVKAKNESKILLETKEQHVPLSKYIEMLDQHSDTQHKLSQIINTQSHDKEENIRLTREIIEEKTKLSTAASEIQMLTNKEATIKSMCNIRNFDGTWKASMVNQTDSTVQKWEFGRGSISIDYNTNLVIKQSVIDPVNRLLALELATFDSNGMLDRDNRKYLFFVFSEDMKELRQTGDIPPLYVLSKST